MKNFTSIKKFVKSVMLAAFVAAGVQVANAQETTTYEPVGANQWWMGEDVAKVINGSTYLFNVGAQIFATDNTPSVTDIKNAAIWTIENGYKFTNSATKEVIYMHSKASAGYQWTTNISSKNGATSFDLKDGVSTNKGKVYCLSKTEGWIGIDYTRYFNVEKSKYTAAESKSANTDWLFISATQKAAYDDYKELFNKLKDYLSNETVAATATKVSEIEDVLKETSANSNSYNTYNDTKDKDGNVVAKGDQSKLKDEIDAIKKFIDTATGIKNIDAATSTEATAIYNLNGVRKSQLTKGINIVKMADGKVKKVLVK